MWVAALLVLPAVGCVVGQRPGQGKAMRLIEPSTSAGYWLYLPEHYEKQANQGRHLPLVMTFHGMNPFDSASGQIREWQQEADRYGYAVCAPELLEAGLLSPVPLTAVTPAFEKDEARVLAIMDHLARTVSVDPNKVVATSFSYGGYLAHYMVNHHPDRFSCIAVKQSNFSESILDPEMTPRYRDYKVGIFYTQNDLRICREESQRAAQWYHRHGFDVRFGVFKGLGHERTPSLAAALFAQTCGATPRTPPVELAKLQLMELPLDKTAEAAATQVAVASSQGPQLSPARDQSSKELSMSSSKMVADATDVESGLPSPSGRKPTVISTPLPRDQNKSGALAGKHPTVLRTKPIPLPGKKKNARPARTSTPLPAKAATDSPIRVRLSSHIGISPLLVSYSVGQLPARWRKGAFFLWTDNGEPISNAINGQKFLIDPGEHQLEVLVTTVDGHEYRATETITVLERISTK